MNARIAIAIAAAVAACGEPAAPGPRAPRRPEPVELEAARVVEAVLDECHRPVRHRMQHVKVRVTLPTGRRVLVQAALPDRVRVHEGRREHLLRDGEVFRVDDARGQGGVDDATRREVQQLARLVDAVAFGPLYRDGHATVRIDGGYTLADGTVLRLRPDSLLPASLTCDGTTVHFDDYLQTPTTWIVSRASTAGLGACDVLFEDGGVRFRDDFFAPPGGAATTRPRIRMPSPGVVVEAADAAPSIHTAEAERWVVLPDPGTWPERHAAYRPVHDELVRQQQFLAGFPMLFRERDANWLAAPFRRRPNGPAFAPPDGWVLREHAAGRELVVYATGASVAERMQNGRALLERALQTRQMAAAGPVVAQPFVHLHEGAPDAERLGTAKVRVSVRIE